uniref:Putative secreted protein n=1 Tax=Anopheles darlingi TaxID=43151 RepID=A0A2M4DCT8_ANODA
MLLLLLLLLVLLLLLLLLLLQQPMFPFPFALLQRQFRRGYPLMVGWRFGPLDLVRHLGIVQVGTDLKQQLPVAWHNTELSRRITAEDVEIELSGRYQMDQLFAREPLHIDEIVIVQIP